jgi:serine/threonine protein kinase
MELERWQEASRILEIALERDPDRRAAYLGEVCANDDDLRREVESLLAASEQAGSLLDSPAMKIAAPLFVADEARSMLGQSVGRYKIVTALGAGGMGEVYLAHDTRLGRKIALKLLPAHFTTDKDRLRRFEQEAQSASTLSHPNVCVIHEVGESENGRHYIAMELVDGVTLRQHLGGARLKFTEALDIAMQVAAGLEAAHTAGIVHRDIKPENVMVRSDALVKVLDFGLAKRTAFPVTADTDGSTKVFVNTGPGTFMGTVSYMSPEQLRGLEVDARTDIWSLGVVLYEMVSGIIPFEGDTPSDVIVSVLTAEPPALGQHAEDVPAELEQIVTKALRKESEQRYQTVVDMALDLKSLKEKLELSDKLDRSLRPESGGEAAVSTRSTTPAAIDTDSELWTRTGKLVVSRTTSSAEYLVNNIASHKKAALLIAAVMVMAAAGGSVWLYTSRFTSKSSLPPMRVVPFTSFSGKKNHPAFSPDGNRIAFAWGGEKDENFQLYVKQVGDGNPLQITFSNPAWDYSPTWSPDGQRIAFLRNSNKGDFAIFMVSALGGSERKLLSLTTKAGPDRIDWSPDGKFIATSDVSLNQGPRSIFLISPETGEKRALTSAPARSVGDARPCLLS